MSQTALNPCNTLKGSFLHACASEVVKVKSLFRDRKYKRCIMLCEELYRTAQHPAYRAFLSFYQAICYETMGIAAHSYSSNKIPFLEFSMNSFQTALTHLQEPETEADQKSVQDIASTEQQHDAITSSMTCLDYPISPTQNIDSDVNESQEASATASSSSQLGSKRSALHTGSPLVFGNPVNTPTISRAKSAGRSADKLENPTHESDCGLDEATNYSQDRMSEVKKPVQYHTPEKAYTQPPQPFWKAKPLPPLPFNHRPRFQRRGDRLILIGGKDARTPEPLKSSTCAKTDSITTPITPRFRYIAQTFAPMQADNMPEGRQAIWPLDKYNDALSSLRQRINQHLDTAEMRISDTRKLQQEHKASQSQRMASFWCFKPSETLGTVQPKQAALQERIARLKAGGWVVSKEQHGWKGQEHYDMLRFEVETEILQ